MFRNSFLAIVLLACAGPAMAQDEAAAAHPREHLDQFMKQCMDATDNRPMCQCAQNAYRKIVPAGAGKMVTHENHEGEVLQIDEEQLASLAPAVQECEAKFAKN